MHVGGYDIDILVQGYPGRSGVHGGLGWSTIVLLRGHGRIMLLDTGSFGIRKVLLTKLKERRLSPKDITDLILSHSHYDHAVNWPLFRDSHIFLGALELDWALSQPWGETPVPELCIKALSDWPTLQTIKEGQTIAPGITAHLAPGHTPGHLIFILHGEDHDVIFLQDAVKSRAELVSRRVTEAVDARAGSKTCEMVWDLWRQRPGTIIIPGHDLPMVLENGAPLSIGTHAASIAATLDDDPDIKTTFKLTK